MPPRNRKPAGNSNGTARPHQQRYNLNGRSQPSRNGNSISSSNNNGNGNATIAGWVRNVAERLGKRLKQQSRSGGLSGFIARACLDAGEWAGSEWVDRRDAIGGIDQMWLLLSSVSDFNPVCTATYTFKSPVKEQDMIQTMSVLVDSFPKYRQRLANVGRRWHGARFVDDPKYDVRNHVSVQSLPGKAGKKELEEFTSSFIAQDWDLEKPLWQSVLLDNFSDDQTGAKCAMVTRGHHSLTDGQGFVMSQLSVTSFGDELRNTLQDGAETSHSARRGTALPSKLHKALKQLDPYEDTLLLQLAMFAAFWTIWTISTVLEFFGGFYQVFQTAYLFVFALFQRRFVTASYPGPRTHAKEFSVSHAYPMSDVKKLQKAFSGPSPGSLAATIPAVQQAANSSRLGHLTLNDVLCTIIADVIKDELDARPAEPGLMGAARRAWAKVVPSAVGIFIPISIREPGDWDMRNLSTGSLAYLPTVEGMPTAPKALHAHLHATASRLAVLKHSIFPTIAFKIIQLSGQAPILYPSPFALLPESIWNPLRAMAIPVIDLVMTSFTAVLTNVPGPAEKPVTMAGQEVIQWTALPPQAGKGTLGIGIISYAGSICISVSADHVRGSEGVARRLTAKFEKRWSQYLEAAEQVLEKREG